MRVLYLDQHVQLTKGLFGPDDEVHTEMDFFGIPRKEVYSQEGNPVVLGYIRDWGSIYDLVVIGNNLGAGVVKAAALNPQVRHRAVICWNDEPNSRDKAPYEALGYRHFTTREMLAEYILEHPEDLFADAV